MADGGKMIHRRVAEIAETGEKKGLATDGRELPGWEMGLPE
jgi:hypothetical protein